MIEINKELLDSLFVQAESSDRKRINHDLRTSLNDGGQRMLNAMLRSTIVPIHRHPMSNENVILLVGKMDEVFYDDNGIEHTGFSNSLGDLKKNIEYLIGMERQSGSMDVISPLYVSRMLNVPLEDVEQVMKEL